MRGRTNVAQRKSPTIHGAISNMVVATGATVSVGDFVQYKVQQQNERLSAETSGMIQNKLVTMKFDLGNDKFTVQENGVVKLVSVADTYTELGSITGTKHWKLSDGNIAVINGSNLQLYSIVNDEFNLLQTVYINIGTTYLTVCQLSSGKILCVCVASSNGNAIIFDYSNGVIDTASAVRKTSFGGSPAYLMALIPGESDTFVLYGTSGSNYKCFGNGYKYSQGNITSIGNTITDAVQDGSVTGINLTNNNYTIVLSGEKQLYIYKNESTQLSLIGTLDVQGYVELSGHTGGWLAMFIDSNKILVGLSPDGNSGIKNVSYFVVEIDTETDAITTSNIVTEQLTYTQKSAYYYANMLILGNAIMNSSNNIYFLWYAESDSAQTTYSGKYIFKLNYFDGVLTKGYETTYVEKWNGGRALGFAKSGGNGGSVIQVYIPQISS